ncbi:MAG: UDP-N-acetylmuramoyl-L-alanine--D-glutamate ligase [Alphaproteobacteria bacterium]
MIPLTLYAGSTVAVFGLGKAGRSAIAALHAGGAQVFAWDDSQQKQGPQEQFTALHYNEWPWEDIEILVLSPGVPLTHPAPHPVVQMAQEHGCIITCDVALLIQACRDARTVGITGTNGKSTTTALIHHILDACGVKNQMGGNIGTPALDLQPLGPDGVYVLELSSYQLDLMDGERFHVAVWMNISPDHLDRHGGMDGYVMAKRRIFAAQQLQDSAVISVDDEHSAATAAALVRQQLVKVSTKRELPGGVYVKEGVLHHPAEGYSSDITSIASLTGRHNWQNAAMAYAACFQLGLAPEAIRSAMQSFPGLRHRLQRVAEIGGVWFINDSKATNADSTSHALSAFDNIYWIAGGKAKEGGIDSLAEYFPRIRHAFLIGEAEYAFARTLEGKVANTRCGDLQTAVTRAAEQALGKNGAVVLLSPACASFDQWANFEQRGDAFCTMVEQLTGKQERHASGQNQ